ncbi:MAG: Hpt domain-containing protein [bacterium]
MSAGSAADVLAQLWAKSREGVLARVAVIEGAVSALQAGTLDTDSRAAAERAAHKLAGVASTFGHWDVGDMAREVESAFEGIGPIPPSRATQLSEIAAKLRVHLSAPATTA